MCRFYRSIPYDPIVKVIIKKPQKVEQNFYQPEKNLVELQYIPQSTSCISYVPATATAPDPDPDPESTAYTYVAAPAVSSRNRTITTTTVGSGYTCVSDLPHS